MEEAVRVVREIMPVLSARGVKLEDHPELTFFNQPELTVSDALGKMLDCPAFQAAIDVQPNPEEVKRMFTDVLDERHRLGIKLSKFESPGSTLKNNSFYEKN